MKKILCVLCVVLLSLAAPAYADETAAQLLRLSADTQLPADLAELAEDLAARSANEEEPASFPPRSSDPIGATLERALELLGVRYKRGGSSPESGFDCSGFVRHVYQETLGLLLPHNARAMAQQGERVDKDGLKPGDLVFFNTMRRAFSHVGIYLGDNLFIHAPRTGKRVRIEDLTNRYWSRRFNGARRIQP